MDGFSTSYCNSLRRFERIIENYLPALLYQCILSFSQVNYPKGFVVDQLSNYLDLAVSTPTRISFKRQVRNYLHRTLPQVCQEFFLAEQNQTTIVSLYDATIEYIASSQDLFGDKLLEFKKVILLLFEDKMFLGISEKDPNQKKLIIQRYLRAYKLLSVDRFSEKFQFLLDLCIKPSLDCELTVDLLETFCDTGYKRLSVFYLLPNVSSLETLILHAKNMRFDFWGLWSGCGYLASNFDFIPYYSALNLSQEYSKMLLKYGFPYTTGRLEYTVRCFRLKKTRFEDRNIIHSVAVFAQHAESKKRIRMMLIMDTFLIFGDFERTTDANDRIKTLTYLIRSVSMPYVTPTELYNTMVKAVVPDFEPQLRAIVFKYANSGIFEDDIKTSTPRRLMHLCRVALRKFLAENFKLLDGIQELGIHPMFQTYLELES